MLVLYIHVTCWPCELYLAHVSHICSVIYVKHVTVLLVEWFGASHFIYGLYMCIHLLYMHVKFLALMSQCPVWWIPWFLAHIWQYHVK